MPKEVNITLPTHSFSGKKKMHLNLNQYRNWHYRVSSNVKRNYYYSIQEHLDFQFTGEVSIHYEYYAPDKRVRDLMNVVSVVDKFFQDSMVMCGCILADDTSIVKNITVQYMGIDRGNSRIEATIKSV
jgi:hypothetical protein|tara:strand:+ start:173 stop:556 length:384 start_codon:yes stop_codon:yes gene_type:complete